MSHNTRTPARLSLDDWRHRIPADKMYDSSRLLYDKLKALNLPWTFLPGDMSIVQFYVDHEGHRIHVFVTLYAQVFVISGPEVRCGATIGAQKLETKHIDALEQSFARLPLDSETTNIGDILGVIRQHIATVLSNVT